MVRKAEAVLWESGGQMKQKEKKFISVRVKILCSLVFVSVLLMICVVYISYTQAMERVKRIGMQLSGQYAISAGEDIKGELKTLCDIADEVMEIDAVRALAQLSAEEAPQEEYSRLETEILRGIERIVPALNRGERGFDNIAVYMKNGYTMELEPNGGFAFSDYESCVKHLVQCNGALAEEGYQTPFWQLCGLGGNLQQSLVYVRFIYEPITLKRIGVVVFGLKNTVIKNVLFGYAPKGYILSDEGSVIVSQNRSKVGSSDEETRAIMAAVLGMENTKGNVTYQNLQGQEETIFYYRLASLHGYLVVPFELEEAEWEGEMESYVVTIVAVSFVLILLGIILSLILSRSLTNSVSSLMAFLGKVEQGDESLRYEKRSNDEIGTLGDKINRMLDELQQLNLSREQEMKANQLTELRLMQQQINPHLLYNTLDSVLWGMQQHNYEDATEILMSLSEFFKLSLSRGQMEIPLSEEIRMVESYMAIQNKARHKQFRIACQIPEKLQKHPIMKLTLQPLVENSVGHGFAGYRDDGEVRIQAWQEADCVAITVEDNGIGMEREDVEKLQAVLRLPTCPKEHRHFGLHNIHRRIVQKYGEQYGLSIESELSDYTRITVRIPLTQSEAEPSGENSKEGMQR